MMTDIKPNYYHSLYEVAVAVNSSVVPEIVLRTIVESVANSMAAKGCALMLLTSDERLVHVATYGLSDWYIKKGSLMAKLSIPEALEGEAVIISDVPNDDRIQYKRLAKKEGIASILSVPMILGKKITGTMRVYSAEPRVFNVDDIYFACVVANLGAIALENAVLHEFVEQDYDLFYQESSEWRATLDEGWIWHETPKSQADMIDALE